MTSALLWVGVNARDLRAAHGGVVHHDVLAGKSVAGAHIRAGDDPDDVEILFFSSGATPMSESDQRAIEKVFVREEYRRAHGAGIGELSYPGFSRCPGGPGGRPRFSLCGGPRQGRAHRADRWGSLRRGSRTHG